ncbi:MAG: FAD-dependent oxidoreductase, partial [Rhodoferax sp.]
EVVLATGVTPRTPDIEGVSHPKVMSYLDVLRDNKPVGKSVAVIGAGGIGFDVSEFLTHSGTSPSVDAPKFYAEWGIDAAYAHAGGIQPAHVPASARHINLLQRKESKVGDQLGKTTGWIHRTSLKAKRVGMTPGVQYQKIDDAGLHIRVGDKEQVLAVDNVILCAGQEPQRELYAALLTAGCSVHLIGGADVAAELDAKRAIDQGTRLAAKI